MDEEEMTTCVKWVPLIRVDKIIHKGFVYNYYKIKIEAAAWFEHTIPIFIREKQNKKMSCELKSSHRFMKW